MPISSVTNAPGTACRPLSSRLLAVWMTLWLLVGFGESSGGESSRIIEIVYRGTQLSPQQVQENGGFFAPAYNKGSNYSEEDWRRSTSLYEHALGDSYNITTYVSTTTDPWVAWTFAIEPGNRDSVGWIAEIHADERFIDVDRSLKQFSPFPDQCEVVAMEFIPHEQIVGWHHVTGADIPTGRGDIDAAIVNLRQRIRGHQGQYKKNAGYDSGIFDGERSQGPLYQLAGFPKNHEAWTDETFEDYKNSKLEENYRQASRNSCRDVRCSKPVQGQNPGYKLPEAPKSTDKLEPGERARKKAARWRKHQRARRPGSRIIAGLKKFATGPRRIRTVGSGKGLPSSGGNMDALGAAMVQLYGAIRHSCDHGSRTFAYFCWVDDKIKKFQSEAMKWLGTDVLRERLDQARKDYIEKPIKYYFEFLERHFISGNRKRLEQAEARQKHRKQMAIKQYLLFCKAFAAAQASVDDDADFELALKLCSNLHEKIDEEPWTEEQTNELLKTFAAASLQATYLDRGWTNETQCQSEHVNITCLHGRDPVTALEKLENCQSQEDWAWDPDEAECVQVSEPATGKKWKGLDGTIWDWYNGKLRNCGRDELDGKKWCSLQSNMDKMSSEMRLRAQTSGISLQGENGRRDRSWKDESGRQWSWFNGMLRECDSSQLCRDFQVSMMPALDLGRARRAGVEPLPDPDEAEIWEEEAEAQPRRLEASITVYRNKQPKAKPYQVINRVFSSPVPSMACGEKAVWTTDTTHMEDIKAGNMGCGPDESPRRYVAWRGDCELVSCKLHEDYNECYSTTYYDLKRHGIGNTTLEVKPMSTLEHFHEGLFESGILPPDDKRAWIKPCPWQIWTTNFENKNA
ncbi:putative enterotoxin [Ophiocordyceps unilateralis]|uniref:Enterotoxin n=1 Tax=Ophiocordyceps unilateralis TaxID=268505 RepID=A0A2A9PAM8_OPHUN|nr:putative enterotoxin [Ophiocordyceps unilateralis]